MCVLESTEERATESYRSFLRAAVVIGMLGGAALGAVALTHLAVWGYSGVMPEWRWWPALIQAHGNAQLFGWTGLFVIGVAFHSLPRILQRPGPPPVLARATFALVFSGLALGLVAQPLAAGGRVPLLFPVAMALQAVGVSLFAAYVLKIAGRPRQPSHGFIVVGTLWFWMGALARFGLSVAAMAEAGAMPPASANAAYLHAMTWGFLLCYVLGYSLRLLPVFVGLPSGRTSLAWAGLLLLTAGTGAEALARLAAAPLLSTAAMGASVVGIGCALAALRVWAAPIGSPDADSGWLRRFAATAYGWLVVAGVLLLGLRLAEAVGPVSLLHAHAIGGASRHALTVGFVSLMLVGVAWRILPLFSGAAGPRPGLVGAVFSLLVAGSLLRVGGQVAAGLWGGGWYAVMGVSGWPELAGVTLFAVDVLRLLGKTPERAALPDVGPPVALSLTAPVGPLVAHRPWLIPVFAGHGMGQVANPIFQRSVGQRVTVLQGCQRFGVEPEAFLNELHAADRRP
jgi:hypothetical protein